MKDVFEFTENLNYQFKLLSLLYLTCKGSFDYRTLMRLKDNHEQQAFL